MEAAIIDKRGENPYPKRENSSKYLIGICVLFFLLIIGRAVNDIFLYGFIVISLPVFLMSNAQCCFVFLMFLLPFSTLLKPNVDAISFFTILFFITILKMFMLQQGFDGDFLVSIFFFVGYNFLSSGFGQITTIITMAAGMMMLYCVRNDTVDVDSVVIAFSAGICLASCLAMFRTSLPIVNSFVNETMLKLGEGSYATRFSGLQGNPNYYTLDIIVALAAIIVIMYHRKPQRVYMFCFIALSVFGLMSVSKSFLLTWALLILCWFVLSMKQGIGNMFKFIFIVIMMAIIAYYFAFDAINSYLARFFQDSSGTMESVTTGRSRIWRVYIETIFGNMRILFFGNGLNTIANIGKGTHNTYLECLFSLGIFGTAIFLVALKSSMGKVITKRVMWIPVVALLVRMLAIGILTYDSLWFYLALIIVVEKMGCQINYKNFANGNGQRGHLNDKGLKSDKTNYLGFR